MTFFHLLSDPAAGEDGSDHACHDDEEDEWRSGQSRLLDLLMLLRCYVAFCRSINPNP